MVLNGRTTGPLLLNRAGNALTCLDSRRMANRIAKTVGGRRITPHGLRRTFCTAGLARGVPMRDMQIAMRQADARTPGQYDMAKKNNDRHAGHRVASLPRRHDRLIRYRPVGAGTFRALAASADRMLLDGSSQPYGSSLAGLRTRMPADPTCVSSVQERRGQHGEHVVAVVGE